MYYLLFLGDIHKRKLSLKELSKLVNKLSGSSRTKIPTEERYF